jgi:ABC-type lipoprotein release transport system permease subunit
MQKSKVRIMVMCESFMIGITGVLAGMAACLPIILWFSAHPVPLTGAMAKTYEGLGFESLFCFAPPSFYFLNSALIIGILVLVSTIYPLRRIGRLKIIDALHYKV